MGQTEVLKYLKGKGWKTNEELKRALKLSTISRSTRILFESGDLERKNLAKGRQERFAYKLKGV